MKLLCRAAIAVFTLCVIAGCDPNAIRTPEAALRKFCHEGIKNPQNYQSCLDHFKVDSEDAENWYITGVLEKWPRQSDTGFLGMPSFKMNKATGETKLLAIAD